MARSLAFWLVNPQPKEGKDTDVELHFNYWSLKSGTVNYLDIGVRLSSVGHFDSLKFYLPFERHNSLYKSELGKDVCSNHELISAVFNASSRKIEPNENLGFYDITFEKENINPPLRFFTNILAEDKNSPGGVKIESEIIEDSKGVTIEFPKEIFNFSEKNIDGYFRFRINLNKENIESLSRVYDPKWILITNYFESSEIVDFRVNESRNLPVKIRKELTGNSHIKKIHFFLIRDAKSEYKMSHDVYHRCRILEANIWDKYLGFNINDIVDNQMLIYHWKGGAKKDSENIDHFSAFAKFTRRTLKFFDILLVALTIIILGIASSLLTNFILQSLQDDTESSIIELDTATSATEQSEKDAKK